MPETTSQTPDNLPILQLDRLSIGYSSPILSLGNNTISAYPGRIVALLGRNGCGKTTLLRTITGLLPPLKGQIVAQGQDIDSLPRRDKAKLVAFAPTKHLTDENIHVKELVMLSRFPHQGWFKTTSARDLQSVNEAMRLTRILPFANRAIGTLSDGERQRVGIAMALAQETPILLLDEPSAFLDFPSKGDLVALLRQLARTTRRLIVYSTHDLQSALWLSDRLWIMHNATLYDGIPETLANNGILGSVFNTQSNAFNAESFTFSPRIATHSPSPHFKIEGDKAPNQTAFNLARRVMLRVGWKEALENDTNAATIQYCKENNRWSLPNGEYADSLEKLAEWAENQL